MPLPFFTVDLAGANWAAAGVVVRASAASR